MIGRCQAPQRADQSRGKIAGDWRWDIYGQYSRSKGEYSFTQILLDAVNTQNFKTRSCIGTFTPISNRPCTVVRALRWDTRTSGLVMGLRQATPHPEVLFTSSQHACYQRHDRVQLARDDH